MYSKKAYLALSAAGILTLGFAGSALAMHNGGVAHCDACHSMHGSLDVNAPLITFTAGNTKGITHSAVANGFLTKGSDPSSTCLNCHYGTSGGGLTIMSTDGSALTDAGDFFWVTKNVSKVSSSGTVTGVSSVAQNHGHNVVALDFGLTADTAITVAPGGTYNANNLGCTSCHDPHGRVAGGTRQGNLPVGQSGSTGATALTGTINGNFRLLGDSKYVPSNTGYSFSADAPVAVASNTTFYDSSVAFGSGMSEWCANCHSGLKTDTSGGGMHPAGNNVKINQNGYAANYDSYIATGKFTGAVATAYDALVPFERGAGATLATTDTTGPDGGNGSGGNVMCMTCHRAHASAFDNMGRWDFKATFLAQSSAVLDVTLPTTAGIMYKNGANAISGVTAGVNTYGTYQRSLCNKCHAQD